MADIRWRRCREALYEAAHGSLIEALAEFGIAATLCRPAGDAPQQEPLLCFQRSAPGDVLVGQTKIAGSAERRRRGAVLQHGSLLLRRSTAAPELTALDDAAGKMPDVNELAGKWLAKVAKRLKMAMRPGPRSPQEELRAAALVEQRYATADWTEARAVRAGRDSK